MTSRVDFEVNLRTLEDLLRRQRRCRVYFLTGGILPLSDGESVTPYLLEKEMFEEM